jgi:protein gp37
MADAFDETVPFEWRSDLFELIEQTPHLAWLLLTKRPENIRPMIAEIATAMCEGRPPENVWLGTSVEDQKRADNRIPALLKVPAVVHFVSVEPLLEPVDLGNISEID